jgi:hypothetical protein
MDINSFDTSVAMALIDLTSLRSSGRRDSAISLPSPTHSDDECLTNVWPMRLAEKRLPGTLKGVHNPIEPGYATCSGHDPTPTPRPLAMKFAGKRLPDKSTESDFLPEPAEEDMQLKIGKSFLNLSESAKMSRLAGFRMLTSITSVALLPWHIMCLATLRACTINMEVERCAHSNFAIPVSAGIPSYYPPSTHIEKLIAQVPIEFLDVALTTEDIFSYLPTFVNLSPNLRSLALRLTRKDGNPCPTNQVGRSYDALLRDITSPSLSTLIIDTADIEHAAVRQCSNDFFENIYPISSLTGFPHLRRIVAPQEAYIWVDASPYGSQGVKGIAPPTLLPPSVEKVEIIDATTALDS